MSNKPDEYVFTLEQMQQNINVAKDILIEYLRIKGMLNTSADLLKANTGIIIIKKGTFGEMYDRYVFGEQNNLKMQVVQINYLNEDDLARKRSNKVLQLIKPPQENKEEPKPEEPT